MGREDGQWDRLKYRIALVDTNWIVLWPLSDRRSARPLCCWRARRFTLPGFYYVYPVETSGQMTSLILNAIDSIFLCNGKVGFTEYTALLTAAPSCTWNRWDFGIELELLTPVRIIRFVSLKKNYFPLFLELSKFTIYNFRMPSLFFFL